jgi:predicted deacylase
MTKTVEPMTIGGTSVAPGTVKELQLPVARLFTGNWLKIPVGVFHGATPGPRLWLSAALHGDELNGMEIIRLVLDEIDVQQLRGTIVAVPVVNVFGFIERSRYLPDRRDLNRSFPGSKNGSLAGRLAHLLLSEVVKPCDVGIDFHTGSNHRANLPQIRTLLEDPQTRGLAEAFGAPFMCQTSPIRGSLRATALRLGKRYLLFEGGEPLRFESDVIAAGVEGTLRVLTKLGMYKALSEEEIPPPFEATKMRWLRASRSGVLRLRTTLGAKVERGELLGDLQSSFFPSKSKAIVAPFAGLVIGFTHNPLVNRGDALLHLAAGGVDPGER